MSEIFLDMSIPSSSTEEARLKAEGYIEKKYTRTTAKEIEDAFKRHLLKQIIPQRGLTTPAQINALQKEINGMVQETMYEKKGKNGTKVFKFKMFVPSAKLIANREALAMGMNNEVNYKEEFAPENYALNLESAIKAEKLASNVQNAFRRLSKPSKLGNIEKALNKTRKAQNKITELSRNIKNTGNISSKARKARNNVARTQRNLEALYEAEAKPIANLSNMLAKTHINTYKVSPITPSGHVARNETFIESILDLKTTRNNNNRNTNKISTKALTSGLLSSEVRFIRDVVNGFIANGMPKQMAIRAGVILANLPQGELKGIQEEARKTRNITPVFLFQLAEYLATK